MAPVAGAAIDLKSETLKNKLTTRGKDSTYVP
jgi:hypothetical protein